MRIEADTATIEPLARPIEFHNAFNRSMKVSFGALALLSEQSKAARSDGLVTLPTGTEPWGRETRGRNLDSRIRDAAIFVAELGIARAAAAFEDYATWLAPFFYNAAWLPIFGRRRAWSGMTLKRFDDGRRFLC